MADRVTHEETRYVWLVAGAVMLLAAAPFVLAALWPSPALQFCGFLIGVEDGNSYLAKMLQGAQGQWTVQLVYSTEAQRGGFFFLVYVLLGKVAWLTGVSQVVILHVARLLAIPWALYSFYRLAAFFTPRPAVRRLALVLFAFTGGFGWLWVMFGLPAQLGDMPVDLWVPDASFFLSALTFPHLLLKQGLLFWFILGTLRFLAGGRLVDALLAASAGLGCSLIHPYTLPVIGVPLGIYALWQGRHGWKALCTSCARLTLVTLLSVPYLLYAGWFFRTNPVFAEWQRQSPVPSPALHLYLIGFGIPLVLAILGLVLRDAQLRVHPFLWIWAIALPPLLYLPVPGQRRFLDGYQALIALLAARGLYLLCYRAVQPAALPTRPAASAPPRHGSLCLPVLLAVAALSSLFLLVGATFTATGQAEPVYRPAWEMAALGFLAEDSTHPAVLSAYATGNLLPAYASLRTFLGHGAETVDFSTKEQAVHDFFAQDTPDRWRRGLLARYGIDYVYHGPREKALGHFDPRGVPYLELVYDRENVQLYRVMLGPIPGNIVK